MRLKSIVMVIGVRTIDGKAARQVPYQISILYRNAPCLRQLVRKYSLIENKLPGVLDVVLSKGCRHVQKDRLPCIVSLSACSGRQKLAVVASVPGNSRPDGKKATCSESWQSEFGCDCCVFMVELSSDFRIQISKRQDE